MGDERTAARNEPRSSVSELRRDLSLSVRALAASFRTPDLRRTLLAFTAFSIFEWAGFIALMVFAFEDGGTAMVGFVSLVLLIPAAAIAPFGSVLGDRFRRELVFLLAEIALAVACLATAVVMLTGAAPLVVYLVASAAGWILTLIRPVQGALLPWIVADPAELTSAYTASGVIESVCVFIGPAVATAGFVIAEATDVSGPGLVFAILAGLLAVGAVLVARIGRTPSPEPSGDDHSFTREVSAGIRYLGSDRRPRLLVTLYGLGSLLEGFSDTLIVVLAFEVLGTGQAGVGALNTALGVGGIVGAAIALVAGARERLSPSLRTGTALYGLPVVAAGVAPGLAPLWFGVSGCGSVLVDVSCRTMLQRLVPDEKLTRVYGILESSYLAGEGIGAFVAAVLVTIVGGEWTLVIAGALLPIAGFVTRRGIDAVDVGPRVPAEDLELLRGTPIFEPLPATVLERVARNSVHSSVPAETVVIREGDVGDRFYVVASGEAEVTTAGRRVSVLRSGDYAGEIALLRDVPRTATVTTLTEARLLTLEREEFLRAITGHEAANATAHSAASGRLEELDAARSDENGPAAAG
jgi:MFS family permease